MAVVKNLMVRAGADFSAITTQANKAKASMTGMQASVSKSCSKMTSSVRSMGKVFAAIGVTLSAAAITAFAKDAKSAYESQAEAETKLTQVMQNTIGASQKEIQSIKDLVSAQQKLGVIGDEVQLAGAQELATYVSMTSTLQRLIPVMNDMVAQQYGYSATAENATNIATMLGKVLSGQTSGLSRYGYYFTSSQEAILKFGSEAQRAATLAEVVEQSVGGMNAALAASRPGRLKQVSNVLGDIKENFGLAVTNISTTFIPALNGACSVLANLATLANKVAQSIANVFGGGAASGVATVVGYTSAATEGMEDLTDATTTAGKAAKGLGTFGFDTLQKISGGSSADSSSAADEDDSYGGGVITETAEGADEAAETVGWLEKGLARLKGTIDSIDFSKLTDSLDRLKISAEPLSSTLFSGLKWGYDNVLEPLAKWSIEDAIPSFLDTLGNSATAVAGPLQRLGTAVEPLVSTAFSGLKWAYDNVFIPFASWTGGELAPAFLDALAGAADLLSAAAEALQPMATWLWDSFLQPIASWSGGVIVDTLGEVTDGLRDLADVINGNTSIGEFFTNLSPAQSVLFGIAAGLTAIGVACAGLSGLNAITTFIKNVQSLNAVGLIGKLGEVFLLTASGAGTLKEAMEAVFGKASPLAGVAAVIGGAALAFQNFLAMLDSGFSWIREALMVVGIAIAAIGAVILGAPAAVAGVIAAIVATVATAVVLIKEHWNEILAVGQAAWEGIKGAWSAAGEWFSINIITPVGEFFSGLWTGIQTVGSTAWETIKGAWADASSWFSTNVITPLSDGFKGLVNGVIGFFEGLGNAGVGAINNVIGGLNGVSFETPDWVPLIGGKQFGFNIPTVPNISLPRLADGAVLPGGHPFAAIVNDQTSGVNVETPLDTIKQAVAEVMSTIQFIMKVTAGPGLPRYLSYELEKQGTLRGGRAIGG